MYRCFSPVGNTTVPYLQLSQWWFPSIFQPLRNRKMQITFDEEAALLSKARAQP